MDKSQIAEIIKAHPELSIEEVRRQSMEAGLSAEDFENAWSKAHPEEKGIDGHDRRVREIRNETKRLGKATRTREEWKGYFKGRGYLDDECDLGYVMEDAKINYGPLPPKLTLFLLSLIGIVSAFYVMSIGQPQSGYSYSSRSRSHSRSDQSGIAYVAGGPALLYFLYLRRQFQKFSWKVTEADFGATLDPAPSKRFVEWKKAGAEFLGRGDGTISLLFSAQYDGRPIHFGKYSYSEGSGKRRHVVETLFIVQKTKTAFPHVLCRNVSESTMPGLMIARQTVQLEGTDFNRQYRVYANNPTDAFYALNPRVMSALLDKKIAQTLRSFEVAGDLIVFVFSDMPLDTGVNFSEPIIRFKDYESVKAKLLAHLDLATDINDVLSREIIDDGSKRSEAKIV